MKPLHLVTAARRAAISKLVALLLIVLAALPFTAPFASFSPADMTGQGSESSGSPAAKTSEKAIVTCHVDALMASARTWIAPQTHGCRPLGDASQSLSTVLRL